MSRRPATFTQGAVRRAILGAESAGKVASAVRINPQGEIEIVFGKPGEQGSAINPWDEVLHDQAKRTA